MIAILSEDKTRSVRRMGESGEFLGRVWPGRAFMGVSMGVQQQGDPMSFTQGGGMNKTCMVKSAHT